MHARGTGSRDLALQVAVRGSAYAFSVEYRYALTAVEGLVKRYNALKAGRIGSSQECRRKKSIFTDSVLYTL